MFPFIVQVIVQAAMYTAKIMPSCTPRDMTKLDGLIDRKFSHLNHRWFVCRIQNLVDREMLCELLTSKPDRFF